MIEQVAKYSIKYPEKSFQDIADFFDISINSVRNCLGSYYVLSSNSVHEELFDRAYGVIEKHNGVTKDMLLSKLRKREFVEARRHFCALIYKDKNNLSLSKIGKALGLDHTTVIHHLNSHNDFMDIEPDYKSKFNKMSADMYGFHTKAMFSFWYKEDKFYVTYFKSANGKYYKRVSEIFDNSNEFSLEDSIEVYWDEMAKAFKSINNETCLSN